MDVQLEEKSNLISDSQNIDNKSNEKIDKVTTICCNKQRSFFVSMCVLTSLFSLEVKKYKNKGLLEGYLGSVILTLQSKGISYKEQSVFSNVTLPFFLKIFFAPLIDIVFF